MTDARVPYWVRDDTAHLLQPPATRWDRPFFLNGNGGGVNRFRAARHLTLV